MLLQSPSTYALVHPNHRGVRMLGNMGGHGNLLPVLWREEGADLEWQTFSGNVVPLLVGKLQDQWRVEPGMRSLIMEME